MVENSPNYRTLFKLFREEMLRLTAEAEFLEKKELSDWLSNDGNLQAHQKIVALDCTLFRETDVFGALNRKMDENLFWVSENGAIQESESEWRARLNETEIAILPAQNLIAETGTIVLNSRQVPSGELSLLPESLIVICRAGDLLPDLESFYLRVLPECGGWGSHLIFISGPSRTSDIEKKLILGMHGPRKITALIVR